MKYRSKRSRTYSTHFLFKPIGLKNPAHINPGLQPHANRLYKKNKHRHKQINVTSLSFSHTSLFALKHIVEFKLTTALLPET